ncbi:type IX secretion/gliding motility protein PorT/SprT [Psychroflexus planctonicus]|uniref:PorT protein n=1 Tax=Psychroflexus planctonicus TaxID=1526575 RepID=A0ABQ1SEN6_9FLAO|nr:porin family protein [Psychroflexus planctonicus]GGE27751.1 PorT protein [Psychroflexus planctonicus]
MKKICFLLILSISCTTSKAQGFFNLLSKDKVINLENFDKKTWSWGYFLGMNSYDFRFDYELERGDILVQKNMGFNIGLIGNLRLNDYIDLRLEPGVIFTNRILEFPQFEENRDRLREVESNYVHVPLLVKFSTKRINNFKPFIVAGGSIAHNLSSNQDNPSDNTAGQFRSKDWTTYVEVGFGIDFYTEYFKFSPSIRGVFGQSDELVQDTDPSSPWTRNLNKMTTRGVFLNFTFQ